VRTIADLQDVAVEIYGIAQAQLEANAQAKGSRKGRSKPQPATDGDSTLFDRPDVGHDDEEVLRVAGENMRFNALWHGQWTGHYPSQNEADLGLCNHLASYCGPGQLAQVGRLFLKSELGKREKASVRKDYLSRTVAKAYASRTEYYEWPSRDPPSANGDGNGRGTTATAAGDDREVNEAADDPHRLSRIHLKASEYDGQQTLRYYRDEALEWREGAYRPVAEGELRSRIAATVKAEFNRLNLVAIRLWNERGGKDGAGHPAPKPLARKVTRTVVSNATMAMQSMTLLPGRVEAPAWPDGQGTFDPREVLPLRNALVHLPGVVDLLPCRMDGADRGNRARAITNPTPRFFSTYSLDFDFDIDAPVPVEWLKFLASLWPGDSENQDLLQEFIGLLLTPDLSHQKIGVFIGPPRSGRGTIARLIGALLGPDNVAAPTLSGLASNFGLSPLIGKPVAIIGDARVSSRSDWAVIVERLLSISGEDTLTIDRKHLPPWTGKLPTRLVLISNELPRLPDQSGALVSRYLMFRFTESFLGKEDKTLDVKLRAELPGILLWAIEGWRRLRERGYFLQPKSGQDLIDQARDMSSPVGAFVRERLKFGTGCQCTIEDLFAAWCAWCEPKKREPGDETTFGRNLRTVIPALETKTRRGDKTRGEKAYVRYYEGIGIKTSDDDDSQ
jgi:putative DNA primase/helicase